MTSPMTPTHSDSFSHLKIFKQKISESPPVIWLNSWGENKIRCASCALVSSKLDSLNWLTLSVTDRKTQFLDWLLMNIISWPQNISAMSRLLPLPYAFPSPRVLPSPRGSLPLLHSNYLIIYSTDVSQVGPVSHTFLIKKLLLGNLCLHYHENGWLAGAVRDQCD